MRNLRLIARLDIKGPHLIKGVHLEGLRKIAGAPEDWARRYAEAGMDEILYMDIVASLYDRFSLSDLVRKTVDDVFIPVTVGGGLRTLEHVRQALQSGADKVAVNTAAIRRPEFIEEIASEFGQQVLMVSVEAKRQPNGGYLCFTDNGREHTGREVLDWVQEAVERGAGEVLVTSIDQEGTQRGFDLELAEKVTQGVDRPVIISGGFGQLDHLDAVIERADVDAVAFAHVLHYERVAPAAIRERAASLGRMVREV